MSPLFHNIMVVTSPIGEKAPPELAAMITSEAYIIRSWRSATSLRRIIIITILVVRLSRMADKMNVMKAIRHNKVRFERVFITVRTQLKPPFWSTISTMVMAPIRKKSVVDVSPRCSCIMEVTFSATPAKPPVYSGCIAARYCIGSNIYSVQQATNISKAIAALFTLVRLSVAMHAYPNTKAITIMNVNVVIDFVTSIFSFDCKYREKRPNKQRTTLRL